MQLKQSSPIFDALGWLAIVLIQGATLPPLLQRIITGEGQLPPLTMVLMIWAGLALYLARAIKIRDIVGITSNAIGFILQSVVMGFLIFPY